MTGYRKKLIEVALPLDAINKEAAREKSIRHGHPSTLHLWWARRPLAACRAVLFASLVDDPAEPAAPPAYLAALDALPKPDTLPTGWDTMTQAEERRERLFAFIARLVKWEASTDELILDTARELINLACEGNPPPVLDPFCGGGSIPLEAQRLGLEAHASDLNPVAVLITKALIEIPPKFAGMPPVSAALTPDPSPNPGRGEPRSTIGNPRHPLAQHWERGPGGEGLRWKGAAGLAADVRHCGRWMRDEAERRIGHLYPKATLPDGTQAKVIAWLWARTVPCPNPACGARMPLVRSFALSTKPSKQAWVEPVVDHSAKTVRFEVKTGAGKPPEGTKQRGKSACLFCNSTLTDAMLREQASRYGMGALLMAVVAEGDRSRIYLNAESSSHPPLLTPDAPWLDQRLPDNPRWFSPPGYGLPTFADLFTPRQLVALTTFSDLVGEARAHVEHDALAAGMADDGVRLADGGTGAAAYADAVAVYLALGVSKMTDYNSSLVLWSPTRDQAKSTFARQALPMVWDFAEVNPLAGAAGDPTVSLGGIAEVLEGGALAVDRATTRQLDATTAINGAKEPTICTDPPYYDNIGYADLADFFYVWQRRSLQAIFPTLFATLLTPKAPELVATPYRFGGSAQRAQTFFEEGLARAFARMQAAQHHKLPLTIYYAFKQAETKDGDESADGKAHLLMSSTGWETMLGGLLGANFQIAGTWPMRSERGGRTNSLGTNALASSILIVCRPRPDDAPSASRAEFLEELGIAMREALPVLASGRVAPVDLAQASIGPGMAVYSKYSKVIRQDGMTVTVREALMDINNAIAAYRSERVSSFDPETRFCIDWYRQFGWSEGQYGDADVMARAYNVGPNAMERDGLLNTPPGKVRLETLASYPVGVAGLMAREFRGSTWEACLRLTNTLAAAGEEETARLAREIGEGHSARARELDVWLYTIADSKKLAEDAFAFNALDSSWTAIQEQVARLSEGQQSRLV